MSNSSAIGRRPSREREQSTGTVLQAMATPSAAPTSARMTIAPDAHAAANGGPCLRIRGLRGANRRRPDDTIIVMGAYVAVRGWIELDQERRADIERVIERHQYDHYSGGWAMPAKPFNWTLYVFYGGDIREGALPWLRTQLTEIAAIEPIGSEADRPIGLFALTDEEGLTYLWEIRDGSVTERATNEIAWLAR
jgi:hypothetical protein